MLRSRLYEFELEKKRAVSKKLEDSKLEINFGSQIRSYVLQPYRLAKDHRTKVEVGDVDKVLNGYLEPFLRGTCWPSGAARQFRLQPMTSWKCKTRQHWVESRWLALDNVGGSESK